MRGNIWLNQRRWLLGGLGAATLALAVILLIWAIQAHEYQLALAHYNATYHPFQELHLSQRTILTPIPYRPPADTSGPNAWGLGGWSIRLLAILLPMLTGVLLDWRHRSKHYMRVHKTQLGHATSKLAEAIGANQALPDEVFEAYSRLRELESGNRQ